MINLLCFIGARDNYFKTDPFYSRSQYSEFPNLLKLLWRVQMSHLYFTHLHCFWHDKFKFLMRFFLLLRFAHHARMNTKNSAQFSGSYNWHALGIILSISHGSRNSKISDTLPSVLVLYGGNFSVVLFRIACIIMCIVEIASTNGSHTFRHCYLSHPILSLPFFRDSSRPFYLLLLLLLFLSHDPDIIIYARIIYCWSANCSRLELLYRTMYFKNCLNERSDR